jgi:hypothetical protein
MYLHQYIGGQMLVPPIGKEMQTGRTINHILWIFVMLAAPLENSTNLLVC